MCISLLILGAHTDDTRAHVHGLRNDEKFSQLRDEFIQSYTPEEQQRIANKQSYWEDANGSGGNSENATHDAYIRGYLNEPSVAMQGHEQSNGTMYSPKQLEILNKMESYIKNGE